MPLQGAIVVCYGGGRVTTNFGGVDVVPLLGAIAGCHCSGEGDDELWGSGPGAIAGCHCSVLRLGGHFFLYIDNPKNCFFCYLGSMLV